MRQTAFNILISLLLIISFVIFSFPARKVALASHTDNATRSGKGAGRGGIKFERPPVRFEINEGQTDPQVRFTARERDGLAYLTSAGATLQIIRDVPTPDPKPSLHRAAYEPGQRGFQSSFVRLKTAGANPNPRITGLERLPGVTNYFIGNDPRKWRTNVAGYARVKYEEVYPGIDLVYYGNDAGRLEYDFIVKPGADPRQIAISIEGADRVEIDPQGDLIISTATGSIRQPAPRIYQEVNGTRQQIAGSYRLLEPPAIHNPLVAFELAEYDNSRALVIDPEVIYATYLGGSSTDASLALDGASDVAVDATGSVYIAGTSASADFPTRLPLQGRLSGESDAFVTKLDPNGQLVYSTYLGGSGTDYGGRIEVDATGAAYVGGTPSFDFPMVNPIPGVRGRGADVFVTKLSPDGSQIVYSTAFGSSDNDRLEDLALDAENNLFVLGSIFLVGAVPVHANDFPTVNPLQARFGGGREDGFMSVISPNGSTLLYSTYLGGDGDDRFGSIDVDPSSGDVYLSFFTDSSNFPPSGSSATTQSAQETINKGLVSLIKIEDGTLELRIGKIIRLTVFPSSITKVTRARVRKLFDRVRVFLRLVLDEDIQPNTSVGSEITSAQGAKPQAGGGFDARITVVDQDLNITNTVFFGGSREETVSALEIDDRGAVYITGNTTSTDLPTVNPIQANHAGGFSRDGFLAVFHPQTLAPVFATYLGGSGRPDLVSGVTVDKQGNIYVVGLTYSTDFPTATPGAIQNQLRGISDAFIIKISRVEFPTGPDFSLGFDSPSVNASPSSKVNLVLKINRTGGFNGPVTITRPDTLPKGFKLPSSPVITTGDSAQFKLKLKGNAAPGSHQITFSGRDESGRERTATLTVVIH